MELVTLNTQTVTVEGKFSLFGLNAVRWFILFWGKTKLIFPSRFSADACCLLLQLKAVWWREIHCSARSCV